MFNTLINCIKGVYTVDACGRFPERILNIASTSGIYLRSIKRKDSETLSFYLSKITAPLKRGDMILYRRSNGMYVLHRILRVEAESYTLLGDAQTDPEPGIRTQQILARVSAVRRKGKLLQNGSFWWEFFAKFWLRAVSLRPALLGLYSRLVR